MHVGQRGTASDVNCYCLKWTVSYADVISELGLAGYNPALA